MEFFIGWLIVLVFEALFIYLVVADPSNWLSILMALVGGFFFISMTIAHFNPEKRKKETSITPSIPINENPSPSMSSFENIINIKAVGVTVDEEGNYSLNSPRQKRIQQLKSGDQIILIHEPENKYDRNAISICNTDGKMLGYLPKTSNVRILEEITKNNVEKVEVKAVVGGYKSDKAYGLDISIFLKSAAANLPKDNTSKVSSTSSTSSIGGSYLADYELPDPRDCLVNDIPTLEELSFGNDYDFFDQGDVNSNDVNDYDGYDPGIDPGDYY